MKYTVGNIGKAIVAKIENGDDLLLCLEKIARKENIKSGIFFVIGAIHKNKAVCGPIKAVIPAKPFWQSFPGPSEIVGIGTIFQQKNQPKIHLHSAIGRGKFTRVGCLRNKMEVFLIVEAVILEIKNVKAKRMFDKKFALSLLEVL
ncbi:MAG: hypothetical protein COS68_00785 [Elusimicrobia bacterium CG06_land_8_20_14_3_00_38_11]|nr:MAG: hypothetical protein COS68_00785 [Elusimicrobia bacterium CG06_land_8_20_14_3_00_38_11]